MSNGDDMIIHLIAGLIKKMLNEILLNTVPLYKNVIIFLKDMNRLVEILMLKLIYLVMQQNLI